MYEGVKFPVNALLMNQALVQIATFDLINTADWIDPLIYDLPEGDAFNINFEQSGYEQTQLIPNISVILWMYILHGTFILGIYFPIYCVNRGTQRRRCGTCR
jgi:hypothetical protein